MGRPKLYPDAAAKHRAYRKRLATETMRVDRRRWAALEAQVERLGDAVEQARRAGCPVAKQIRGACSTTTMDFLTEWFVQQAALPRDPTAAPIEKRRRKQ
ncbi:MAG TPA: hypothetical protein PLU39_16925 [Armatimonadota bacterium]|nr:hypothetical protein [Armatimonadota bacterium]HPT99546.1 hypothetical protein [Armatimonadota bacterium]